MKNSSDTIGVRRGKNDIYIYIYIYIYQTRSLLEDIKTKQLKWYGHVQRMEEGRLPKKVMKRSPPGRRKRGRPKLSWAEEIRGLIYEKGLTLWRRNYFFNFSTHCI